MKNPIKDNRIISDITFAVRLCGFLKEVTVNDPMSEEDQEYLIRVAKKLITHQVNTVTDEDELDYINRIKENSIVPNLLKPYITEDGFEIYEDDKVNVYSCFKHPSINDENITFRCERLFNGSLNSNRVFFLEEKNRDKYVEDNMIQYSKKDLEKLIKEQKL